ncbi:MULTISPECIES: isoprenyl transferase [unclassified Paenibacillus]|uniref:isoprenyl transferase n=1 Tax=unclassified Paenibacillus TaxID=185978 RepID=UPI0009559735|nr:MULTISPECIES: isoprenyl transferase [unclassified Paenibacillus]ASS65684.1 isoprenyl transferase [Paenibacillus sp. RUD330]SIQ27348.1 undecaprenyl diphosphate synthase [Paenibacillus sp. RU4X]SIQ49624.1 undecaprenyl diphosphate synthase [Paenibacillus sp. RU4T]
MIERLWSKRGKASPQVADPTSLDNIPEHVAIIMDGNGRWAQNRGLPRIAGHHSGMKAVKKVTMAADRAGVKYLTLYAFSTENWKRPKTEVDFLMRLPQEFLALELEELVENNVQVRMMGYRGNLPDFTLAALDEAIEKTKANTGLVLNFALNYGSRSEMLDAVKSLAEDVRNGGLEPGDITEEMMAERLLSSGLPDPDLLIRTSGELRLSNFMLWQMAYSELWFTDVYWPAFTEELFQEAIAEYQRRARRFGGI